jgi:hypothetical protein
MAPFCGRVHLLRLRNSPLVLNLEPRQTGLPCSFAIRLTLGVELVPVLGVVGLGFLAVALAAARFSATRLAAVDGEAGFLRLDSTLGALSGGS